MQEVGNETEVTKKIYPGVGFALFVCCWTSFLLNSLEDLDKVCRYSHLLYTNLQRKTQLFFMVGSLVKYFQATVTYAN